jgi:hypothetical protein
MAKRKSTGGNKSAEIRSYKAGNPEAGPQEIASALAKDRVKVSAAFVSTVLSNDRRKAGGKVSKARSGEASVETLLQAKKLAAQMGGIGPAREALNTLAKLLS